MGLTRIDDRMVAGDKLTFEDKGTVSKGSKTRKFAVMRRYDRCFLGYVKYFAQDRQFSFFPQGGFLNRKMLREVADYCEELTLAWRAKRKPFPMPPQGSTQESFPGSEPNQVVEAEAY